MNSQQLLSPYFNPQISQSSTKVRPDQPLIYSTSQVRAFPANPQPQYYVTSTAPQPINNSFHAQQLAQSRLDAYNQSVNLNSQINSPNLYKNIAGFKQKRQSETRISYVPYTRTYIDYQQKVVLVPVQKVRIKYYQKIYQTQYVPQPIEEIITETIAVEKEDVKIRYIPVETTVYHFPKEEKKFIPEQKERRVIYVDQPIVKESKRVQGQGEAQKTIVQSNSSNLNTLIANFQQNLNSNVQERQQSSNSGLFVPNNISSSVQNYKSAEIALSPSNSFEQQKQQIILQDRGNKRLRQSHVNEVYKPQNEPVDF